MLNFLPKFMLVAINIIILLLSTAFISLVISLLALFKLASFGLARKFWTKCCNKMMRLWLYCVAFSIFLTNKVEWHVDNSVKTNFDDSVLLISNHISWLDTLVIAAFFRNKLPVPKFFLKSSLLYVPFAGLACWGLDMPFLHRYSTKELLKHPELRTKDIETTRTACAKFKDIPTTMVNFTEGTRCSPQKILATKSPYQNLLSPKAMSMAVAIDCLGRQFKKIINVTLYYPNNLKNGFKDFLFGDLKAIYLKAEEIEIPEDLRGHYLNDKVFKRHFSSWLKELWTQKDQDLSTLKASLNKISPHIPRN